MIPRSSVPTDGRYGTAFYAYAPDAELRTGLLYPDEGSERWLSEPFHPFTMPAHTTADVGIAITLGTCPSAQAQPTRAPEASLLRDSDPALSGGFGALDTLRSTTRSSESRGPSMFLFRSRSWS